MITRFLVQIVFQPHQYERERSQHTIRINKDRVTLHTTTHTHTHTHTPPTHSRLHTEMHAHKHIHKPAHKSTHCLVVVVSVTLSHSGGTPLFLYNPGLHSDVDQRGLHLWLNKGTTRGNTSTK